MRESALISSTCVSPVDLHYPSRSRLVRRQVLPQRLADTPILRLPLSFPFVSFISHSHLSHSSLLPHLFPSLSFTFEPFLHAKCTTIFWSKGNRTQPLPSQPRPISMLLLPAVAGLSQLRSVQARYRALVATPRLPKLQTIRENTASTSVPTSQPQRIQLG